MDNIGRGASLRGVIACRGKCARLFELQRAASDIHTAHGIAGTGKDLRRGTVFAQQAYVSKSTCVVRVIDQATVVADDVFAHGKFAAGSGEAYIGRRSAFQRADRDRMTTVVEYECRTVVQYNA
ncbi:hypothetical protein D3C77_150230 [compost metagenome]